MSENDREINIVIKGKNLTKPEFDAARQALAGLAGETDRARASAKKLPEGFDQAGRSANQLGLTMGSLRTVAGALGVSFGIGTVISFGKSLIDTAGTVSDLAARMGVSIEAAQRFQFAAEQTGSSIETVQRAIVAMNDRLATGDKSTVAALTSAGIKLEDLRKMRPEDAFKAIATAVHQIPDPMRQTQVALDLFGKSGAELLPAIRADFVKLGESVTVASDEAVEALDAFGDALSKLATDAKNWSINAAGGMVLGLDSWAEAAEAFLASYSGMAGAIIAKNAAVSASMANFRKDVNLPAPPKVEPPKPNPETERWLKRVNELAAEYSGRKLDNEVRELAAAIESIGGAAGVADPKWRDLVKSVDAFRAVGVTLPPVLDAVGRAQFTLNDKLRMSSTFLSDHIAKLPAATNTWRSYAEAVGLAAVNFSKIPIGQGIPSHAMTPLPMFTLPDGVAAQVAAKQWVRAFDMIGEAAGLLDQQLAETAVSLANTIQLAYDPKMSATDRNVALAMQAGAGLMDWRAAAQQGNRKKGALAGAQSGAAVGAYFAGATGGLSIAVGAGIGAIAGAVSSGGPGVNDIRDQWMAHMGGLKAIHEQIGKFANDPVLMSAFSRLYNTDSQERFQEQALRFENRLRELMDEREDAQQRLNTAIEKYGFTIDELGPKWRQQQLSEQAKELILDYTALTASGIDVGVVTEKMAGAINDYLAIALKTGTEVPQAMRPILQKMIELGLLTNENGEHLTDLATIPFAETMAQGFDRVIAKLEELIKKITGDLGDAITDIPDVEVGVHTPGWGHLRPRPIPGEQPTGAALGGVFEGPMNVHIERGRREIVGDELFMDRVVDRVFERRGIGAGQVVNHITVNVQPGDLPDTRAKAETLARVLAEELRTSGASRTRMRGALDIRT